MPKLTSLVLLLAGLAAMCGCNDGAPRPSVVIITIDTLRADHCSCYGYGHETTPRLDALAAGGVRFANTYAPMPTTGPTHSTIFTSLYPLVHGVLKNGFELDASLTTLAEVFQTEGYATAGLVSSYAVNGKFGYSQGFDFFDDDFSDVTDPSVKKKKETWEGMPFEGTHFDRRADMTTDKTIAWLEGRPADEPFFLWVHYFDPHHPYDPPEKYRGMFPPLTDRGAYAGYDTGPYDGEVRFADEEMGRLVDYLDGRFGADSVLLVVASDHGEGLGQHGRLHHGFWVYEEAMRVPLVMRWPGRIPAGRVHENPVELNDVMPTILALLDLPFDGRLLGHDLSDAVVGSDQPPARPILMQRRFYEDSMLRGKPVKGTKFAIRDGDWKYILAEEEGTEELYNLAADPFELDDVSKAHPDRVKEFRKRLGTITGALEKIAVGRDQEMTDEDHEAFRQLGYAK